MSANGLLAAYCLLVLLFSMFGGWVPFLGKVTHGRLQLYLSLSAGVMLGASFFHVMPEAMSLAGENFGWYMSLGVVGLFCIERFIAPHSHEVENGTSNSHAEHHHEPGEHCHHHHHEPTNAEEQAAPTVAGWMAVLGLSIHTFMNGVGLAGQVRVEMAAEGGLGTLHDALTHLAVLPGMAMFLAIVLHKPADALAISTVLARKGVSRQKIFLVQLGFAAMVPVGAVLFMLSQGAIEERMQTELTGAALAFSAGTFLFIALSDLLPEVQFHRHDRGLLFGALVLGVALMGGIALLEGHDHGGNDEAAGHTHSHDHGHHHHH